MKKQSGLIEDDFIFSVVLIGLVTVFAAFLFQDVDVNVITELSPEVKQEIREAVKDGIQASRAEELQQLREVQNPPASPRNIHF